MTNRKDEMKCARRVCKQRSANPTADGWKWSEFDREPPKTSWWCPSCAESLQRILVGQGIKPATEHLH
jgi:hypothetical protein